MLEHTFQPAPEDLNSANHIDNVKIYGWLDEQRYNLFVDVGFVQDSGLFPSIAKGTIEFKAELFADAPITMTSSIKKIGNSSFVTEQTMVQNGKLCVTLESVAVNFDQESKSSAKIPAHVVDQMTNRLVA